jgi:hypothetical protein
VTRRLRGKEIDRVRLTAFTPRDVAADADDEAKKDKIKNKTKT